MLQGIRNASQHWLGKIVLTGLFTLLIAGVGIYGVEEFFRGGGSTAVATVGKTPITAESVRTAYQNQLQRYQQQLKRVLSPEQARGLGLERQVLGQLITEAALDQKTHDLGLAISDEAVLRLIREEAAFKGAGGQFDRSLFYQTLSRAGLNEATFVRDQRAVAARLQLADAITAEMPVPQVLRAAVHRYATERRSIAAIDLTPAAAGAIPAPTDDELKAYYDNNKSAFRAPETRALTLLVLDPEAMAKPEAVSEAEVARIYAQSQDRYGAPEKRTIEQITFPDQAAAEEARGKIAGGEQTFEATAAARGIDAKSLSLGTLARGELFDPAVAAAAFALDKDAVSQPVKGRFGTVLLRVTGIEPATRKPLEEVAPEIRRTAALEAANEGLKTAHAAIEDARAGGKSLDEIARERGLETVKIPAIDAQGNDAAGAKVAGVPDPDTTLPAAFRAEQGGDNEPLRTKSGGSVWYDVTGVEPAHDKPLDTVREAVVKGWTGAETAKRLSARARELAERLDKGETPEALAAELGLQARTLSDLARNQPRDDLAADAVERVFATAVGKAGSAPAGEGRVLFKVVSAEMPAYVPGSATDRTVEKNFRTALADDVLGQFIAFVQKEAGVNVNQAAFRRALGGEY